MYRFYFRLAACLLVIVHCTRVPAQDVVLYQGFEVADDGAHAFTTSTAAYGTGGVPTFNAVTRIKGIEQSSEGDRFWAVRDARNSISDSTSTTLTFDAGDICALTSARFVFDYNIVGYDGGDDFGYELYLDGFLDSRVLVFEGANGGGRSTDGWISDTVSIPGRAKTAKLLLFFDQNGDDVAGLDNLRLIATGDDGSCAEVCGLRLGKPTVNCTDFTAFADELTLSLPYDGAETGAVVSIDGATIGGDDPGQVTDGRIELTGLLEGQEYLLEITGGDCAITEVLEFPADQCAPSDIVINEVLAAPREDVNGDGKIGPDDEFVEIYNNGITTVDLSGHTLHDASNSGARFTFPEGELLGPGERFTIFAGDGKLPVDCRYGVANGFLGLNDNGPERVTLRNTSGRVVAQATFDDAPTGESLVLHPDGNVEGGYRNHTEVSPLTSSACKQDIAMPVDMLYFLAEVEEESVRLEWATSREVDNERFAIERSADGNLYIEIGSVAAGGSPYTFIDAAPLSGQNLYRLRQIDFDGATAFYGPVSAELRINRIGLYPNPTNGRLFLTGGIGAHELVSVYSADGKMVLSATGSKLDVARLPAGSYYLRLRRPSGTHSLRFMKE